MLTVWHGHLHGAMHSAVGCWDIAESPHCIVGLMLALRRDAAVARPLGRAGGAPVVHVAVAVAVVATSILAVAVVVSVAFFPLRRRRLSTTLGGRDHDSNFGHQALQFSTQHRCFTLETGG